MLCYDIIANDAIEDVMISDGEFKYSSVTANGRRILNLDLSKMGAPISIPAWSIRHLT